jgi:hypothetical protein
VQNLAKLFALLFLVAISYKHLVLCQMASTLSTCMLTGDNDDEQEDQLSFLEQESLVPQMHCYTPPTLLWRAALPVASRYAQSCIIAPIDELHVPPPNKA